MVVPSLRRQETFTVAANGTTVTIAGAPMKYWSVSVKGTGAAATAWDVRLEGSNDGTNFTQIIQQATADGDGVVKALASPFLCTHFRLRLASITLGGATNVIAVAVGSQ